MNALSKSCFLPLIATGIFFSTPVNASAWDRFGGCGPRGGRTVVITGSPWIGGGACSPWVGGAGWGGGGWGGGWGGGVNVGWSNSHWFGPRYCAPRPGVGFGVFAPTAVYSTARVVSPTYYRSSRAGYADDLAVDVQRALRRSGYYYGDIDGDIGPESRAAIREYQRDRGLPATGRIDSALLRALRIS